MAYIHLKMYRIKITRIWYVHANFQLVQIYFSADIQENKSEIFLFLKFIRC